MKNVILRSYFKEIKENLPCFMAKKKAFLKDFWENLDEFSQEKPDAARGDYVERFGTPEEIAISFLPEAGSTDDLKKVKRRKRVARMVIVFFAAALALLIGLAAFYVQDRYNFYHGGYAKIVSETVTHHSDT